MASEVGVKQARFDEGSVPLHGTVAEGFEAVREVFAENLQNRDELGAACAVYYRGEPVVDLWGGYRDVAAKHPWEEETMVPIFSATKGMTAAATAVALSRGLFDLDDRVADHWPSFGRNGKSAITVREILDHRAGLAAFDRRLTLEEVADQEFLSELLAAKTPEWEPGTRYGYHAYTVGWYQSELLRRVDGRTSGQFFAEEVAEPLGLQFYIGLPEGIPESRLAELKPFSLLTLVKNLDKMPIRFVGPLLNPWSITSRAALPLKGGIDAVLNPELRSIEIPAENGIGTVRSIARVYGDLATGGRRLGIDESTFAELTATPVSPRGGHRDVVLGIETAYSMGYSRPYGDFQFGSTPRSFGTPGAGGAFGFADPDAELGFSYAPNRLGVHQKDDPREKALRDAVYRCLTREPSYRDR
ncbi:serine hydrolase domain-containing protein [Haladaptatus sp. YSMS36]|uniref:serine hydrolase domain-containing protein n=1 Tax=Haladaptatus sp. YSMS36 TaxID=3033384 RepID=UPI0023E7E171|nr:serine hydrolase domain-containing protein [Haladaptatus sp. YSMS36]